jgi:hypothetical protein
MPILYGDLLSNYRTVTLNGKRYLLDSWTEILQQDVSAKSFIQGDIADRIVEVSNPLHQGVMNGPILILRDSADVFKNTDPMALLVASLLLLDIREATRPLPSGPD